MQERTTSAEILTAEKGAPISPAARDTGRHPMARESAETKPRPRRLGRVAVIVLLAIGMIGGYWLWQHPDLLSGTPLASLAGSAQKPQPKGDTAPPVPVHAATVKRGDFPVYLNGLGTVQAWNSVTVRSRVDGQVEKISFEEGQPVKEGDVLVQLDARPFQAALDQATAKIVQDQANLVSAQADLDRTASLVGNGYATKQLFDQQTAAANQLKALIKADQAAEENARVSLGYTTIRAPISGRLGLRTIDIGNIVHASDQNGVVTIAEIQPIAVLFTAPEDQIPEINRGLKSGPLELTALTPDGKTELGRGALSIINNDVDIASGTIRLKGRFENADTLLWPGLSVTTRLLISTLHDVVVVPDQAVQRGPSGLYAYVIGPDQNATKRDLEIGPTGNGQTVVTAGLEPGDVVVTAGHYRVQPGAKVAIDTDGGTKPVAAKPVNKQTE
jgi:multidrug efflux system membrane fusion protein